MWAVPVQSRKKYNLKVNNKNSIKRNTNTQLIGAICPILIKILFLPIFIVSFMTLLSNNLILWWRILILVTLIFLTTIKGINESYRLVKYFMIQEAASLTIGVLILFSISILIINIIIIIKIAIAPFHFWIINTLHSLQGWAFSWVLTFQKLPGLIILTQMIDNITYFLLLAGSVLCSIQMILTVKPKAIILFSTTVTSRWVILTSPDVFLNLIFLIIYFCAVATLLNERNREQNIEVSYIIVLVLLRFPLTLIFILKVIIVSTLLNFRIIPTTLFLLSTLGATLAYMEILKIYTTTREVYLTLQPAKGMIMSFLIITIFLF